MTTPMTTSEHAPSCLTVYHDGSCPLCRREIALARRLTQGTGVTFIDVSGAGSTDVAPGLSADKAMRRFHVQRADGTLIEGAAAFLELWSRSPRLVWLQRIARVPVLLWMLDRLYSGLLIIRPAISGLQRRIEG